MVGFAAALQRLMDTRGMSVTRVAKLAPYSRQYVWELSTGRKTPSSAAAAALDRVLDGGGTLVAAAADERGNMRRRALLGAAAAGVGALVQSSPADATTARLDDLDTVLFGPAQAGEPLPLSVLRVHLTATTGHYHAARYQQVAHALPGLLRDAEASRDNTPDSQPADMLLAQAYALASAVAVKLHEQGVAWSCADRAVHAAHASGDPRTLAAARRQAAIVMRRSQHRTQAQQLILTATADLHAATGLAGDTDASLYAGMMATAAYTAALADRRVEAWALADEAGNALAGREGVGFGPNALMLYRSGIARALGDYGQAVTYAQQVRVDLLPTPERRARYYEDTALAWWGRGRPDEAYGCLLAAERDVPQEVRYRPWAQQLTVELLSGGRRLSGLREFAARVGVS